jgi:UDP-N-acetylmuramoyl-tripeptide--D-alanyl-D-alanine ligase
MKNISKNLVVYILKKLAQGVVFKYKPKIIAITGSVGKTSTKDAVYAVVSKVAHVRKSEKSFNSQIGLPLTILGVPNAWNNPLGWIQNILQGLWLLIYPAKYPRWLVLEVGIGKPGDMDETASWLRSDVVIITAIGETPVHIEFFESRDQLIEEKSRLIKTLKPDGLLVLNKDDDAVMGMKEKTKCRLVTYGFKAEADVMGGSESIAYTEKSEGIPEGIIFRAEVGGASLPVEIEGVFGRNHIYASLAALAVAHGLKWNMLEAIDALKHYEIPPGRMRIIPGISDSFIIDDTYNSSPFACEAALRTLGEVKASRKIAVLGDMLELGRHTNEAHAAVGALTKDMADYLLTVGPRAQAIKEGAEKAGMNPKNILEFTNSGAVGEFLESFVKAGDLVLVKGSQGMRMERVVERIMKDKSNARTLLVRQEDFWKKKD